MPKRKNQTSSNKDGSKSKSAKIGQGISQSQPIQASRMNDSWSSDDTIESVQTDVNNIQLCGACKQTVQLTSRV